MTRAQTQPPTTGGGRLARGATALQDLAGLRGKVAAPVVIYLLAVMLPIGFQLGPVYMTGVRLVLIFMILPLTVQLAIGRYGRILLTDVLFFLHVLWIGVALAVNNPDQVVANAGSTGIEFIGGYMLGRAYIRTPADFIALIRLLTTIALCLLPFAIYEALSGRALILQIINSLPGINSLKDVEIGKRMGLYRVQTVFAHPIHSGLFCTIALSLAFIGLKDIYSPARRIIGALGVGLIGFLALSSGALLAILLQIMLISWAFIFTKQPKRWLILLGVFICAYIGISLLSNRPPLRVFMSYATFSPHTAYMRSIIFNWGMINVWANPIFGLGLNDWVRASYMAETVDNFWLLTAMRYGIPGFLTLAIGYGVALGRIGWRQFDGDQILWQLRRAWMFSFAGLTFTLCTVHIWHTVFSFVFFMFGAGMWMLTATAKGKDMPPAAATPADNATPPQPSRRRGQATDPRLVPPLPEPLSPAAPLAPAVPAIRYTRFAHKAGTDGRTGGGISPRDPKRRG